MELVYQLSEIEEAAEKVIPLLKKYPVGAFHGEMGSGKTTFIKILCRLLGSTDMVSSPTFSIINEYENRLLSKKIYHLDLYRLKDEEEAIAAGVEDCLNGEAICLIEWPEIIESLLPKNSLHLRIKSLKYKKRKMIITIPSEI